MNQLNRVILHADLNGFYASVECLYQPKLWKKPMIVCGDPESRHGIVLAKNQPAKQFKIKTGEAIWQAKAKCPDLICLPADYQKSLIYSRLTRQILADYSDQIEAFGLDEAWLDVSGSVRLLGSGPELADQIRQRVRSELGLTCSVGVSFNKIFAKLGSDLRKPDATTVITREHFRDIVWPLPVGELLYVGPSTRRRLGRIGIRTIGALAAMRLSDVRALLGKWGETLWLFANGRDSAPVQHSDFHEAIKSVGNSTTTPRDLENENDVRLIFFVLAESVAARLRQYGLKGQTVQIYIRDNQLAGIERQGRLSQATDLSAELALPGLELFRQHYDWRNPIRSLGIRATNLVTADQLTQLSWFSDEERRDRQRSLEQTIDSLRSRFGHFSVQRGLMLADRPLSGLNPRDAHQIHPIAFRNHDAAVLDPRDQEI